MAEARLVQGSERAVELSLLAVLVVVGLALVAMYFSACWFCAASSAFRLSVRQPFELRKGVARYGAVFGLMDKGQAFRLIRPFVTHVETDVEVFGDIPLELPPNRLVGS